MTIEELKRIGDAEREAQRKYPHHVHVCIAAGCLSSGADQVHGNRLSEGMLNRVEAVIRTFGPYLSCSTHADGRLALELELRSHTGAVLDRIAR